MVYCFIVHSPTTIHYERYFSPLSLDARKVISTGIVTTIAQSQTQSHSLQIPHRDWSTLFHPNGSTLNSGAEVLVWKLKGGIFYSLLLERDEDEQTAENVLAALTASLPIVPSEKELFTTRVDELVALFDTFLPSGLLYSITPPHTKFLKREADIVSAK
jgi:homoserine dehydrogenase